MIRRLLEDYAAGRRPRVIPDDAELSTFQAAELLNARTTLNLSWRAASPARNLRRCNDRLAPPSNLATGRNGACKYFVTAMVNNLTQGANDLTASDPNEESANMLSLQTRHQLGIATLGLTNQSQQGILRLF